MKYFVVTIGLLSTLWLAGCGQKGDLYQSAEVPPPAMEEKKEAKTGE